MNEYDEIELCPIAGKQEQLARTNLPRELFRKKPWVFTVKLLVAAAIICACITVFLLTRQLAWRVIAVGILGVMYAHLVELQHELLHGHAYNSRRLNEIFGILVGLPMLSSYHAYQASHLRHHRDLGSPNNREFFSYRHRHINGLLPFLRSAFSLHRYGDIASDMWAVCRGGFSQHAATARQQAAIRRDYILMSGLLVGAVVVSLSLRTDILVYLWFLPAVCVAEAVHFLIETPEHYGLNTQSNPDPLSNTRTIYNASLLLRWLTNVNDLHTAHHYHHGVPICNMKALNALILERVAPSCLERNYVEFYARVLAGAHVFRERESCMT